MSVELTIKDLFFRYKKDYIFEGLDLRLKSGINLLLGHNGCGKSTLIKILANILEINKGHIELDKCSFYNIAEIKSKTSYLPQDFNLYPQLKGYEILEFIANIKLKNNKSMIKREIDRVIEVTDISDFINKRQKTYSIGMKQRLGIAQCLIGDPKLILVDEPTAPLDPEYRHAFYTILSKIKKDKIILVSTHIIEDINSNHDYIIVMNKGKIKFEGNYDDFVNSINGRAYECYTGFEKKDYINNKYLNLNTEKTTDGFKYKIVGEIDSNDFINVTEITEITMNDIWLYHRLKE